MADFFSPKRRPGREEVTTDYLDKFPYISPSDFKVTGEATPGYLYCLTCPTYILKYIPKVRLLFTLRNPLVRAYSEYLNKRVDGTVMRYLHKRIDNKMDKELTKKAPPFARLVEEVAHTMQLFLFVRFWYRPTGQSVHAPPLDASTKRPGAQSTQ